MPTVTGRTAIIGVDHLDDVHVVTVDGEAHAARTLVRPDVPSWLEPAAHARVLRCLECGTELSAIELYAETPVPGECADCAWDLLSTAYADDADEPRSTSAA